MKTASMCFSVLQDPRCRNLFLRPMSMVSIWSESFHSLRSSCKFRPVVSNTCRASSEGINARRWKQQSVTTKADREISKTQSSKPCRVRPDELLEATTTVDTKLNINKSMWKESAHIKYDVQVKVDENRPVEKVERVVTIIVFDIETTGLSREYERVIEIALRDLLGGKNSTFQTLVNPECIVPNSYIHGITTNMVDRADVPRFADLIPILLHYVQSRQVAGAPVLFVAHNARNFDVPFLINEFNRCSMEIPSDWLFLDTLPLAREFLSKSEGTKGMSAKVESLSEFYKIPVVGAAHRAMTDVNTLSEILRHLTNDLKLSVPQLLDRCFRASDIIDAKKKKQKKKNTR